MASKRLSILLEVASFDRGGLEKVVLDSALRFDRQHFSVTIVSVGRTGQLADIARREGITVYRLPVLGRGYCYRKILRRHAVDLGVSHFSYFGYPLLRQAGIPNVTFIHNVYAHLTDNLLCQFRAADDFVDSYISVSPVATRYAVGKLGVRPEKIVTIPNGLILDEHEQRRSAAPVMTRSQFGLADSDYVFLNVAAYNLHKGHYLMADAMRQLLKQRRDVKILCIGNVVDQAKIDTFQQYLVAEGLEGHLLMPGYFPNVESFFQIADAFLLPSFLEGWSIAMNEAMFYGKPMILTATGGAPEVIEQNDIGMLIPNEYGDVLNLDAALLDRIAYHRREFATAKPLAEAMLEFAEHREQWRVAGLRGCAKLKDRFDFANTVKQYERVFREVIGRAYG